jgi:hypothetical protein
MTQTFFMSHCLVFHYNAQVFFLGGQQQCEHHIHVMLECLPFTRVAVCLPQLENDALSHCVHVSYHVGFCTPHAVSIFATHPLIVLQHTCPHFREYDNDTIIF